MLRQGKVALPHLNALKPIFTSNPTSLSLKWAFRKCFIKLPEF